ncbi:MAG TPA: ABC transporter permease [Chloroflexota bacterium]|nr:ABC transporter permease [Chloroflexota bacterium]
MATVETAFPGDRRPRRTWERWSIPISLAFGLGLWWLVVVVTGLPKFVLPTPPEVLLRLLDYWPAGQLQLHFEATIVEALIGGVAGVLFGLVSGYALAKSEIAEKLVGPYLVASQSVPVVAFTPMLILWFGTGLASKAIVCAVIVFFPMTINTMVGLRSVDRGLIEVMQTFRADRWQILRLIEAPAALPNVFGGLKVSGTLSILGAVVGEFVGAKRGLGFLVNYAAFQLDTPLMFVGLFCLVALGVTVFSLITLAERRALRWRTRGHD